MDRFCKFDGLKEVMLDFADFACMKLAYACGSNHIKLDLVRNSAPCRIHSKGKINQILTCSDLNTMLPALLGRLISCTHPSNL